MDAWDLIIRSDTMRKVIDSNYLQDPRLRSYLRKSSQHFVVLTDYLAMEAYKGNTFSTIYRSMEILAEFPTQVIVLKGTGVISAQVGRAAGLQRRLIDQRQTNDFGSFCKHLRLAQDGNANYQKSILEYGRDATTHMDTILADSADLPGVFDEIAVHYSQSELKILRSGSDYTSTILEKSVRSIMLLAASLFSKHPNVQSLPEFCDLPNTFIFRFSLCAYLLSLNWISVGGAKKVKPERIRNDIVDMNFAAYATYFDGLLTADNKLFEIFLEANIYLRVLRESWASKRD